MQDSVARPFRGLALAIAVLAVASCFGTAHATRIRPLNLEQMTARADRIFSGRCTEVSRLLDPALGREVAVVTFEVLRDVKGVPGATLQIRTLLPSETFAGGGADVPAFVPGEEVVVFLYGDSRAGLTSPVGFGQGKFEIHEDKNGETIAVNARGNLDLFKGMAETASENPGELDSPSRETISPTALLDRVESLLAVSDR